MPTSERETSPCRPRQRAPSPMLHLAKEKSKEIKKRGSQRDPFPNPMKKTLMLFVVCTLLDCRRNGKHKPIETDESLTIVKQILNKSEIIVWRTEENVTFYGNYKVFTSVPTTFTRDFIFFLCALHRIRTKIFFHSQNDKMCTLYL